MAAPAGEMGEAVGRPHWRERGETLSAMPAGEGGEEAGRGRVCMRRGRGGRPPLTLFLFLARLEGGAVGEGRVRVPKAVVRRRRRRAMALVVGGFCSASLV
jgi:hypothetical protein